MRNNLYFLIGCIILALAGTFAVAAPRIPNSVWSAVGLGLPPGKTLTAVQTGIGGVAAEDLADTLTTDAIRTSASGSHVWTEVLFHGDLTAGSTTAIDVTCEESIDGTLYAPIGHCTDAADATCGAQNLSFGVADELSWVVKPRAPWLRCTLDDPADGTGTVIVTASMVSR